MFSNFDLSYPSIACITRREVSLLEQFPQEFFCQLEEMELISFPTVSTTKFDGIKNEIKPEVCSHNKLQKFPF